MKKNNSKVTLILIVIFTVMLFIILVGVKENVIMAVTSLVESNKYNVVYYGAEKKDNFQLGTLLDTSEKSEDTKENLIQFTIKCEPDDLPPSKYTLYAEQGMNWIEWTNSKYNTIEAYIDGTISIRLGEIQDDFSIRVSSEVLNGWIDIMPNSLVILDGKEYSVSYAECVYPNSMILISKDGNSIEARNIVEGDEIAYYDLKLEEIRVGKVQKVFIHKQATNFVKYEFEDGSYLEATDYHPIYTKEGWKSLTQRNGYEIPELGDEVKTQTGWKKIIKIEEFEGLEDCYDFKIINEEGEQINNYFANGTLVEGSY